MEPILFRFSQFSVTLYTDGVTLASAQNGVGKDTPALLLVASRMELRDFCNLILSTFDERPTAAISGAQETTDDSVRHAVQTLYDENLIQKQCDLTWVLLAMNAMPGLPHHRSAQAFLDYLRALGFSHLPSRATIGRYQYAAHGQPAQWTFDDPLGHDSTREARRRCHIAQRFLELTATH